MLQELVAYHFYLQSVFGKTGTVPVFTCPGTVSNLGWHGVQPWWQFGRPEWHSDQHKNCRKCDELENMAWRNKSQKICLKLENKEKLFYDVYSYKPYFPSYVISGDFEAGHGAIQPGQTATKAGLHATKGWTLCQSTVQIYSWYWIMHWQTFGLI